MSSPERVLAEQHRRTLEQGSAILPDVIAERGVRTVFRGRELPAGFSRRQRDRAPGILFTAYRPNGQTSYIFRPDEPDPDNPGHKYEQPCKKLGGSGNVLDVLPSERHLIGDRRVPVIFVEGIKKADAITSASRRAGVAVLVVAISGVWNWLSEHEPIPDMFDIPVEDREVNICFDSDVFRNPDVADAQGRLAEHLIGRGAKVRAAYLPDRADGSKMGADDYLAEGHTYPELLATFRPYDPADFAAERLKRGELLRLALEDLRRTFWSQTWKGMGGHSARDVFKVLADLAGERGKLHEDGLRVRISRRELARHAKVSSRTLQKAIERLEQMGLIYRDTDRRKPEAAGAFVLVAKPRANVKQGRGGHANNAQTEPGEGEGARGVLHLRAPRLRWSSPGRKARRGVVRGTRRVRQSRSLMEHVPPVKRLGKIRGAVLDALDAADGSATVGGICEVLHRSRPRDVRRRVLPMLEEAGIVIVEDDVVTLASDWLERLEEARELGGEIEAERCERAAHRWQSEAFRRRRETRPDPHPVNAAADGWSENLDKLPTPPPARALYALVDKRVDTLRGPGVLWQYIGGEARVVLDADPSRWTALDPGELILEGAAA